MKTLNCLGDYCPIPIIKAKNSFKELKKNESIMISTDHSCVVESLESYFKNIKCNISIDEVINGVWEITLTKLTD